MKIFPKLVLTFSALLFGAIACLSGSFYWAEQRSIRAQASLDQQAILHNLVHMAQESFLTNDDLLLVKYTRGLTKWNPSLVSASVVNGQGQVLADSEPNRIGKSFNVLTPSNKQQTVAEDGVAREKLLVLTEAVHLGNKWIGNASAAFSQRRLDETLQQRVSAMQRRLEEVVLVSLLISLGVCLMVALSWTRPIQQLTRMSEKVGQGHCVLDLGPLSHRHDELGSLARAFESMAEQLHQLDVIKEDFVSAVTHELRSPLGAIESYLNLISDELHEGISLPAWENYLERLRVNTQRLTRFVNDLLDVAALERGKVSLDQKPVNLVLMAQDVLGLFALKLKEKGLSYEVECLQDVCLAQADPDKIRHVLTNLVSNAIKFTPPRGHIKVCLDNLVSKRHVRLSVVDTGAGIAESDQDKIFNKFEQVRSQRQSVQGPKGTGLGLAISKALIELHGQALRVISKPGQGSVFFFELPVAVETSPLAQGAPETLVG